MPALMWFAQLLSYGVMWWLIFVVIAFFAARVGRGWGIILGHLMIAAIVSVLDFQWVHAQMHRPDWVGVPDQDMVFYIGLLIRILLINTCLLPISLCGLLSRKTVQSPNHRLPLTGGARA